MAYLNGKKIPFVFSTIGVDTYVITYPKTVTAEAKESPLFLRLTPTLNTKRQSISIYPKSFRPLPAPTFPKTPGHLTTGAR